MVGLIAGLMLIGLAPATDPGAHASASAGDSSSQTRAAMESRDPVRRLLRVGGQDARAFLVRRSALILLGGGALSGACRAIDKDLDAPAQHFAGSSWKHIGDVGNDYAEPVSLGLGALALLGAGELAGNHNVRDAGFEAGRALFYSYVMVAGLKVAVDRTRPDGGRYSFPSGHAAGACAVAPVLARRFGPAAAIPAYAMVLVTGVGRLEARKHFLSDVVFGAAIGTSVGLSVGHPRPSGSDVGLLLRPDRIGLTATF